VAPLDSIFAIRPSPTLGAQATPRLLAGLRDRVKHVHDTLKAAKAPRPRAALISGPPPSIWPDTGGEQIKRAGGIDVLGPSANTPSVSMEALVSTGEIVFIAVRLHAGQASREAERLLHHADWAWLGGRQVWALDANGRKPPGSPRG
jgi:iron complex transport system substrate-binding protein